MNSSYKRDIYRQTLNLLNDYDLEAALRYLHSFKVINADTFPEIIELINQTKGRYLRLLEILFTNKSFKTLTTLISLLNGIGVDWPELEDYFENKKHNIIKELLKDIQHGVIKRTLLTVYALKDAGIEWSELDIIEKSAEFEADKRRKLRESINSINKLNN